MAFSVGPMRVYEIARSPLPSDDETGGYEVGNWWVDTVEMCNYIAVDVTEGAAIWNNMCNSTTDANDPGLGDDTYNIGHIWINITLNTSFILLDNTPGNALWRKIADIAEGSFLPDLKFGGNTTGIVYVSRSGTYVKIGTSVHFSLSFVLSSKGTSTGNVTIEGLPFTNGAVPAVINIIRHNCGLSLLYDVWKGRINGSSGVIEIIEEGALQIIKIVTNTLFNNNSEIYMSGVYFI